MSHYPENPGFDGPELFKKAEAPSNPTHPDAKPVNPTEVGWSTLANDLDNPDQKGKKWKEVPTPTVAEMWAKQATLNMALKKFAQENPDSEAAATSKKNTDLAKAKLDNELESIYP
jgi:hypothetical protein